MYMLPEDYNPGDPFPTRTEPNHLQQVLQALFVALILALTAEVIIQFIPEDKPATSMPIRMPPPSRFYY